MGSIHRNVVRLHVLSPACECRLSHNILGMGLLLQWQENGRSCRCPISTIACYARKKRPSRSAPTTPFSCQRYCKWMLGKLWLGLVEFADLPILDVHLLPEKCDLVSQLGDEG